MREQRPQCFSKLAPRCWFCNYLVQSIRRSIDPDGPHEQVVVACGDGEALQRLRLDVLQLHRQRTKRTSGRGRHVGHRLNSEISERAPGELRNEAASGEPTTEAARRNRSIDQHVGDGPRRRRASAARVLPGFGPGQDPVPDGGESEKVNGARQERRDGAPPPPPVVRPRDGRRRRSSS